MIQSMKLVDILAREMKVWPEDIGETVGQGCTGYLHGYAGNGHPNCKHTIATYSMCDDYGSETVTREQWQAAVDALKASAWNGEGLPPVGAVCEARMESEWVMVQVMYLSKHTALLRFFTDDEDCEGAYSPKNCQFRPIRTAEQIAADEREAWIQNFCNDLDVPHAIGSRAYDAGYRKQADQ